MLRKIATIFVVILLLPVFVSAQEYSVLRPDGKIYKHKGDLKNLEVISAKRLKSKIQESRVQNISAVVYSSNGGVIDTLSIAPPGDAGWTSNFGYFGQDWMLQWFEAPSDLILKQVGFAVLAVDADASGLEVKVVSINWTKDQLLNADVLNRGYYEASGNGYNDITGFMDNPDITGGWTSLDGEAEPFGADLWSDGGVGFPIDPVGNAGINTYQWVDLSILVEPVLIQGQIFGIAIRNTGLVMDAGRIGFWAGDGFGIPAWKFYTNGRLVPGGVGVGDPGWWSREFTWDFAAIVELTGDRAPVISGVTGLGTTLSPDARTVTATIIDDNPGGGPFGVADATLLYSLDDGATWTAVTMADMGSDVYGAEIPGQAAGQKVDYKISATDVEGLTSESGASSYSVFAKMNDFLLLYAGSDFGQGTASFFYIGDGTAEPLAHDFWSISADGVAELDLLLALYDNVLQIDGSFPDADVSANIAAWIATGTVGNPKAYLQSSQDFGCFVTGDCSDISFVSGDFMYDIMGVETLGPQDFSGGNNDDWQILGVDNDPVSGWVNKYAAANGVDYWYNSAAELGFTNWFDNIVPAPGATTIFTESSTGNVVGVSNQGTGWYTSFLAYDYLGANFLSDTSITPLFDDSSYAWGISVASQAFQFFTWAGVVSVERENNLLPDEYSLSQNYPNPFNPSTTIKFSVPLQTNVVLRVYDILGSEVASLVNETLDAGNYTINFDASQFASGMYIYKIAAGNFVTTKKMMLLK